ncbi:MAG: hypothetical protein J6U20_04145 [Fibrobacter sp.]|nr:hypothetical protein [Fibrobacter sp.]
MSAIQRLVNQIKAMESRARDLASHEVRVGWANEAKEQARAKPKEEALVINAARRKAKKKGKGEIVSNFDTNFIGPGQQAVSLAQIAKTLCYGRECGVTKSGHKYGRIPPRDFVRVLQEKHLKTLNRLVADEVVKNGSTVKNVDLEKIGVTAKGQLQRAMRDSNEYDKNAPITIHGGWMADPKTKKPFYVEPKGSERPLINTGTLIKSVDFEIK